MTSSSNGIARNCLSDISVTVVVPCYKSRQTLGELVNRVTAALSYIEHEVILVEDGGEDGTWERIVELSELSSGVRGIRLGRNSGQHNALLAGIRAGTKSVIVTIDDDLQNPPEAIPDLLNALGPEIDCVYGWSPNRIQRSHRRLASKVFWKLFGLLGGDASGGLSSFRAFRTSLRDGFSEASTPFLNIDALLNWTTQKVVVVKVPNHARRMGISTYSLPALIRHSSNLLFAFGISPLRVLSVVGNLAFFSSLGFAIFYFVLALTGNRLPGFTTNVILILMFGGLNLMATSVIASQLSKLQQMNAGRPGYVVRDRV